MSYGFRVNDKAGNPIFQGGELGGGDDGVAVINPATGEFTKLTEFIFGPRAAAISGMGTRSSSTFGDLTGSSVGPAVTVAIGQTGRAMVFWSGAMGSTGDWATHVTGGISVAVSGATTIAAHGDYSLGPRLQFPASPNPGNALCAGSWQGAMMTFFEDLNPGLNTFTLKYRNLQGSNAVRFESRRIVVFPY